MIGANGLTLREISHRRGNFLLGAVAVALAITTFAATIIKLRQHDAETAALAKQMDEKTAANMTELEDEIRKSMKGLGFNIFIFPEGQNLGEVYSEGYASKTMPEEYVERLAAAEVVKVNHLLPSLTQKITWPEQGRTILLIGTRGEVPIGERKLKKPLIDPVETGKAVVGYELHLSLQLEVGDEFTLMGKKFTIDRIHGQRGSADDITIWLNLAEAQALLGKPGKINAILALECNCASIERLAEVRAEIENILPDTVVIEKESTALARAEARNTAKRTADQARDQLRKNRAASKAATESLAALLVPLIALTSAAAIVLLTLVNVRQRRTEIGTLRAIGIPSSTILATFVLRATFIGILGAALGILATILIARPANLITGAEWSMIAVGAILFSCGAAWLPSLAASQHDPATLLRHD
ncbi:MAG: putative ABC transport system permease protein [Verrucomicrobiales bacterium]|jgi:putative ABC transport system permease protein